MAKENYKIGDFVAFEEGISAKKGKIIGAKKCLFGIKYVVDVAFVGTYIKRQSSLFKII